ncbi:hypothetical protein CG709_08530, partial [Lachnotalea glycerini]
MKKQKTRVLCFIMLLVIAITGCGKDSEFTVGKWNGNTFENSWLNMKFEIPDDWNIASTEEINEIVGAGAEALDLNGTSAEQIKKAAELKTVYSFMVSDSTSTMNAQLIYENLALSIGGTKFTEEEYLDQISEMLLQQESYQYEQTDKGSVEIAGKTFQNIQFSAFDGVMYQEYYSYKMDKFMVSLIISYT